MKVSFAFKAITVLSLTTSQLFAQQGKQLYLDVHHLGAGKVTLKDAAGAHQKDLSVQKKHGVNFVKYWVDEAKGDIYCLAEANDAKSVTAAHAEAHGLLPDQVNLVKGGEEAAIKGKKDLYLDLHVMGAGKVDAAGVAGAHQKDLAVQKKYGVSFVNYWVDEKNGTVVCLAEAPNAHSVIDAHKEAHGLIPVQVEKVKQGH
jgi:hypothetical protein